MTTTSHPGLNKAGRATAMVGTVVVSALTVLQSRINGELGQELDDGILAAWISFVIGLIAIVVVVVASKRNRAAVGVLRDAVRKKPGRGRLIAPWQLLGGLGGAKVRTLRPPDQLDPDEAILSGWWPSIL